MTLCDNCIENECEVNGYVCPLYKKYQDFGKTFCVPTVELDEDLDKAYGEGYLDGFNQGKKL